MPDFQQVASSVQQELMSVVNQLADLRGLKGAWALAQRELVRFVRQRNRITGALLQPLIFWILFGAGLGPSFKPAAVTVTSDSATSAQSAKVDASPDAAKTDTVDGSAASNSQVANPGVVHYAHFFFPGVLAMIVLFTAIFATISIIEDRREGFLQGVLVSPISRVHLVLGRVLGGTLLAIIQACLFLILAPFAGIGLSVGSVIGSVIVMTLIGFGLTSLGTTIAWRMDSTQGYHAIMSVFLFPMWLLSGAFFPAEGTNWILRFIMAINPLTYGVSLLRRTLGLSANVGTFGPGVFISTIVTILFAFGMFAFACYIAKEEKPPQD